MKATEGRIYALVQEGRVHWIFTAADLPQWHAALDVRDVTDVDPRPAEGWLFDGIAFTDPATLPQARKRNADAERDATRYAPVEFLGHRFQADAQSLWLLTFQVNDLNAGGRLEPDFAWWDIDNVPVPMTAAELMALHHAVRNRNYAAMKAAREAKTAITAEQEIKL